MAADDMSVQPVAQAQRTLQIHPVAGVQRTDIRQAHRLRHHVRRKISVA